ncbi:MAG: hypothetical protein P8166_14315 [Candidatus Thiodiazotropha sp.]
MYEMPKTRAPDGYGFHQLTMIRGVYLQHLAASLLTPENLLEFTHRYSEVTHWEELLTAAIDPDGGRLMALVAVNQPGGYSGLFRRHGSIEYVRFFIDWEDGDGYQPVSLGHFKVCDQSSEEAESHRPRYWQVSTSFDQERYWGCMLNGVRPRMRATLSWNQVPELDSAYLPLFGNAVESKICVKSEKALMRLVTDESRKLDEGMLGVVRPDYSGGAGLSR